jgi:hypothetical protein
MPDLPPESAAKVLFLAQQTLTLSAGNGIEISDMAAGTPAHAAFRS